MAKDIAVYPLVQLIECPERWEFYKEIPCASLIICESERKHPGKNFFYFSLLHSSVIEKLETIQESLDSPIYIEITTRNNFYKFKILEEWDGRYSILY